MSTRWLSLCAVLTAAALAGCNNGSGDGSGGSSSSSTTTTTTTTSSSSPTSSSGGDACATFADEAGLATRTFQVHNGTGVPAYFAVQCGQPVFEVSTDQQGTFPGARACLSTCEDLQTTDPADCAACAPQSQRIEPGGTITFSWDGLGLRDAQMPATCFHTPSLAPDCQQLVAAPVGHVYSFKIVAWSGCGDGQTCSCDAGGVCDGEPSGNSVGFMPSETEFMHGDGTSEFTLPACAFGCPNP